MHANKYCIVFGILCIIKLCNTQPGKGDDWFYNMIPKQYKRSESPTNSNGEPVVVVAYATPKFVTDISLKTMDFEVDMDILVEWYDKRLVLRQSEILEGSDNTVPERVAERVWYPSIFLQNCKGDRLLVSTPKSGPSGIYNVGYLKTEASKQSEIGMRVTYRKLFRFTCDFDVTTYPFDVQRCEIQVKWSYERMKPITVMFYARDREQPDNQNVTVPPEFRLLSYALVIQQNDTSDGNSITERRSLNFTFRRNYSQQLMFIFYPSILIVILSWLAFWLSLENPAARVALGVTALLILATQFNAVQRDFPPAANVTAIHIWMFTCMFMVFASLIEYGFALCLRPPETSSAKQVKPIPIPATTNTFTDKDGKVTSNGPNLYHKFRSSMRPNQMVSKVDRFARVLFPVTYIIFNIYFWTAFLPSV